MIVVPHQPEFLPWFGFFSKAVSGDCLCLLDNVQFRKNYYQNRNRIRNKSGRHNYQWIGIPIKKTGSKTKICDIEIDNSKRWNKKIWRSIYQTYSREAHFRNYADFFENLFLNGSYKKLSDLNVRSITYILESMNYKIKVIKASEYPEIKGKKTEMLISVCESLKSKHMILGPSACEYIDKKLIEQSGISLFFYNSLKVADNLKECQVEASCSIIDILFKIGPMQTRDLLEKYKYDFKDKGAEN